MCKILITGALGNVGSYVAKYCSKYNQKIKVADIDIEALKSKYNNDVDCVYFNFTDLSTFENALKDVDRIFIMRPPHLGKPKDLKPFINFIKQNTNVKLVCFLSLIGIENNPVPPHYKIEKYIEKLQLPYCHIRPSFFMQNISGIHSLEIKEFDKIIVPANKSLTSFIDAEDIGELIAKVLSESHKHINTAYSITGPEAIDYFEVEKILSEELGRKITYTNPKPSFAKKYWINIRGIDKKYATVMSLLYMMTRLGSAKKVTSTFEEIMNKNPQDFRSFVKKNSKCWQK